MGFSISGRLGSLHQLFLLRFHNELIVLLRNNLGFLFELDPVKGLLLHLFDA